MNPPDLPDYARPWLERPAEHFPIRDRSYPLPLAPCGVAYWQINLALCCYVPGWSEWQGKKDMAAIIPVLDALGAMM